MMKNSYSYSNKVYSILILAGMMLISGCFFMKDESLYLKESGKFRGMSDMNDSIPIRLNGYFYKELDSDPPSISIYFLYENGIILYGEAPTLNGLNQHEEKIKSGEYYNRIKNDKSAWGVFIIEGNTIKFERWYSSSRGYLPTYIREGKILSDTTFQISRVYKMKEGKKTNINNVDEFYQFKHFPYKPDSTNQFID